MAVAKGQTGATMSSQDQQALQEVKQECQAYEEAYANKNAQALANFFADNAVYSSPWVTAQGKQAIVQEGFDQGGLSNLHITADEAHVIDPDHRWASGTWTAEFQQTTGAQQVSGHWMDLYERDGGAWKITASTINLQLPSTARPATHK